MKKITLKIFVLLFFVGTFIGFSQADCANALTLTPGTPQVGDTTGQAGSFSDTNTAPEVNPCSTFYNDLEYWFAYTAVETGEILDISVTDLNSNYYGVFIIDNCPDSTPACVASDTNGFSSADLTVTTPALTAGTTYYIVMSDWAEGPTTFTMSSTVTPPPSCLPPTSGSVNNVTDTAGGFTWIDEPNGSLGYEIELGADGFSPGTGALLQGGSANPGDQGVGFSGLTPDTSYDIYIRTNCDTDGFSDWDGPYSFTTLCTAIVPDYTADMSVNVPDSCWDEAGSGEVADGPSGLGASDWRQGTSYALGDSNAINLFSNGDREWLLSPQFDLSVGGPYQLDINVAVTNWNSGTVDDTMGSDDEVQLLISTDNGATWVNITTWNVANEPPVGGTEFNYDLSGETGTVQFAVFASDGTVNDSEDYDFHVGQFTVREASSDTPDFFNMQFPATGTISVGDEFLVFAQVYEAGLTDASSTVASGIEAWIGYSTADSNPNTDTDWTWVAASPNSGFDFSQNNDEYSLDLGAEVPPGTYYYASRWRLNGGPFVYGGILADGSNGGEWGTNNFASGVLNVNPLANDNCAGAIPLSVGGIFGSNPVDGTVSGATSDAVGASCGSDGPGVWYSVVVPASGNLTIETGDDSLGGTGFDSVIEAFSGTCGSLTSIDCDDDGVPGFGDNYSILELTSLTPGETIYVRVWEYGGNDDEPYSISAYDCSADAGTLTADATPVSLSGGTATISATPNGDIVVPTGYEVTYVLTSGPTLIIEDAGGAPSFDVDTAGDYTIHTLVAETSDNTDPNFLDLSVIVFGTTTGGDVLGIVTGAGLCASLDVTGAPITVLEECTADAGTLTADATPVSLSGGTATISATPNGDIVVPTGYEVTYVLTSGPTLIIEDAGGAPSFDVDTAGDYTIHTLVAETSDNTDPNFLDLSVIVFGTTTGGDVLGIVTGAGLCASLDVTGAPITVLEECTADAGTLTADATPVSLSGGTATISATPNGDIVVPTGYEVTYVLTSGPTLIIEDAGGAPSFDVDTAGDYTIHTLVAETSDNTDPNFLDLSVIVFGTTTGGDVLGIVTGAGLCASLDVTGAPITVLEECTADAGTLTADATPVSLSGGTATISATPNGDIVVPTGYEVTYVLTSGPTLIIEDAGGAPSFDVDTAGDYTIHTLVAETSDNTDPNFLDLSVIVFGTTTGGDVLGIVTGAGLCASLDVTGAPITVLEECTADAGTLTADATPVSLSGGTATISATPNGDIVVPTGYEVTYVLTSGPTLIIEDAGGAPSFDVDTAGDYTIHTLVAETSDNTDPNFLDLSVIVFGTTTGGDVLGIVTGAGLCASLDVTGAPITVLEECTADAGTLTADATPVSLSGGTATISATPNGDIVVPTGYEVTYVLTSGPTLIIEDAGGAPSFDVDTAGDYTIHTLVAETSDNTDPNFLDLSVIVFGTTTGGDVLGIVTGAGLCASLDVTGAPVTVTDDLSIDDNSFANVEVYPNPVKENLILSNSRNIFINSISLYDVAGRAVKRISVNNNSSELRFNLSELSAGVYILILDSDLGQFEKQIIKE